MDFYSSDIFEGGLCRGIAREKRKLNRKNCSRVVLGVRCPRSTVDKGPQSNESYERERP